MARSMSGINTDGDVKLDGDPNTFTGTNNFNVNRPPSTLGGTPASIDFITKQDGQALFSSVSGSALLAGNPNTFTGTNKYDVNRPTSTITSTPSSTDFITKQNADALYSNNTGDALLAGNPNTFTGTNKYDANRPTSTITSTPASTDFITKQNADALYSNNTGDAILADGTAGSPQTFTGHNTFTDEIIFNGVQNSNDASIVMSGSLRNEIEQEASTSGNNIEQKGQSNQISQFGTHDAARPNIISTTGFVRMLQPPAIGSDCCNKTYVDNNAGTPANMVTTDTAQTISGAKTFSTVVKSTATPSATTDLITIGAADLRFSRNLGQKIQQAYINIAGGTSQQIWGDGRINLHWNATNLQIQFEPLLLTPQTVYWDFNHSRGAAGNNSFNTQLTNTRGDLNTAINTRYFISPSGTFAGTLSLSNYGQRNYMMITPELTIGSAFLKTYTIELWCGRTENVHALITSYGSQF